MLLLACHPVAIVAALSPVVVRMERASRSLAATFIFEGLIQARDPLELFEDPGHQSFWFEPGPKQIAAVLEAAAEEKELALEERPIAPDAAATESASPLLAARARRDCRSEGAPRRGDGCRGGCSRRRHQGVPLVQRGAHHHGCG